MTEPAPERVRVTGPPQRAGLRRARTSEIDDQTLLGSVLVRSLIRSQLRLAMLTLLPVLAFALGVPLAFHLAPGQSWRGPPPVTSGSGSAAHAAAGCAGG